MNIHESNDFSCRLSLMFHPHEWLAPWAIHRWLPFPTLQVLDEVAKQTSGVRLQKPFVQSWPYGIFARDLMQPSGKRSDWWRKLSGHFRIEAHLACRQEISLWFYVDRRRRILFQYPPALWFFSKRISMRVRLSRASLSWCDRSSPQVVQALTSAMEAVSVVRRLQAASFFSILPFCLLPGDDKAVSSLSVWEEGWLEFLLVLVVVFSRNQVKQGKQALN